MRSKVIKIFIIIFLLGLLNSLACSAEDLETNIIRVAIIRNASKINLVIKGPHSVYALYTNEFLSEADRLRNSKVIPTNSGVKIGQKAYSIFGIKIIPKHDASIYINKRIFRGQIDIIRQKNMTLLVVNHVNVEDYVKGVLYHEISHKWPMESIKAQAIASRTFALYKAKLNAHRDYDLTSDMYSQMYGGRTSEKRRSSRGVVETHGEVLTYKGKMFATYFHATCAGHTEDVSVLWNEDLAPLKGVRCNFCKSSKHYYWNKKLKLGHIENTLRKKGYDIDNIVDIVVIDRNRSGRILNLKVQGKKIDALISGKDFRQILNPKIIRSTNFTVKVSGSSAYFQGFGWGHGVGMCQWGAYFMAKEGYSYPEILKFYYPGTAIIRADY